MLHVYSLVEKCAIYIIFGVLQCLNWQTTLTKILLRQLKFYSIKSKNFKLDQRNLTLNNYLGLFLSKRILYQVLSLLQEERMILNWNNLQQKSYFTKDFNWKQQVKYLNKKTFRDQSVKEKSIIILSLLHNYQTRKRTKIMMF